MIQNCVSCSKWLSSILCKGMQNHFKNKNILVNDSSRIIINFHFKVGWFANSISWHAQNHIDADQGWGLLKLRSLISP